MVPTLRSQVCGGALLMAVMTVVAAAQSPVAPRDPKGANVKADVDGLIVADFTARVTTYADLRRTLEEGLPPLVVTNNQSEIRRAEEALARRIRLAREGAREGNIFTPAINGAFKQLLMGVTKPGICAAILDDNPGDIAFRTGRPYPRDQALSTVPPSVLGVLPTLPDDVQYRFVDRDLILYDTRANMMLDRIPSAIACSRLR
jgi:hypothetical protein